MNNQIKLIVPLLFLMACQQTKRGSPEEVNSNDNTRFQYLKHTAYTLFDKDDYSNAIKYFDTLIQLAPRNGAFYYRRGFSYNMVYQRSKVKEAINDYLKAIELGYKRSDAYYCIGLSYAYSNDSMAVMYFEKSLEIDPNKTKVIPILENCRKVLAQKHQTSAGH